MKPNIFKLATKELSQDGFFTWLLEWADNSNGIYDMQLNETAKDFVRLILGQTTEYQINKVRAKRQWAKIDIKVEVNDEYFICIEDKTNTGEHSEQLERYKEIATKHNKEKKYELIFIYLKTGNESKLTLKRIIEKGFSIVDRCAVLSVLNKRQVDNEIFIDFRDYLTLIENTTNSFLLFDNLTSSRYAAEGFYNKLQEQIDEQSHWRYVANQTGGFLGFWYHEREIEGIGMISIQIENAVGHSIKLVIKIAEWNRTTETLYKLLNEIEPVARKNGLSICKPKKYRIGESSTIAFIQNTFEVDNNGNLDFGRFAETLKMLEKTLDEFSTVKNQSYYQTDIPPYHHFHTAYPPAEGAL